MKKKYWIIAISVVIFLILGMLIHSRVIIKLDQKTEGSSIAIIGGADGSTSVFIAGKVGGQDVAAYQSITMEEAKNIFTEKGEYIILDVRRPEEFAEGHIPGAINVANEEIGIGEVPELPDLEQTIYVYCRSGRRSKEASEKLVASGYTNIIECGGILDWTGELE